MTVQSCRPGYHLECGTCRILPVDYFICQRMEHILVDYFPVSRGNATYKPVRVKPRTGYQSPNRPCVGIHGHRRRRIRIGGDPAAAQRLQLFIHCLFQALLQLQVDSQHQPFSRLRRLACQLTYHLAPDIHFLCLMPGFSAQQIIIDQFKPVFPYNTSGGQAFIPSLPDLLFGHFANIPQHMGRHRPVCIMPHRLQIQRQAREIF